MKSINFKKEIKSTLEEAVGKLTEILKPAGFGVLTRIDLDKKIKEKLNKGIPATVILGVCNPNLAYEAYQKNTDVTALLPCNVVLRDLGGGSISVEVAKPSVVLAALGDEAMVMMAKDADAKLGQVLEGL